MHIELQPSAGAEGLRIGLAVSRYHDEITSRLKEAAVEQFMNAGGRADDLEIVSTPGAFELTAACRALARRDLDAVVAIGCVIAGETTHDQHIANAVACGLTTITVETGVPVTFGVLTCRNLEQANARAGGEKGNKGAQAMAAAIETSHVVKTLGQTGAKA